MVTSVSPVCFTAIILFLLIQITVADTETVPNEMLENCMTTLDTMLDCMPAHDKPICNGNISGFYECAHDVNTSSEPCEISVLQQASKRCLQTIEMANELICRKNIFSDSFDCWVELWLVTRLVAKIMDGMYTPTFCKFKSYQLQHTVAKIEEERGCQQHLTKFADALYSASPCGEIDKHSGMKCSSNRIVINTAIVICIFFMPMFWLILYK